MEYEITSNMFSLNIFLCEIKALEHFKVGAMGVRPFVYVVFMWANPQFRNK